MKSDCSEMKSDAFDMKSYRDDVGVRMCYRRTIALLDAKLRLAHESTYDRTKLPKRRSGCRPHAAGRPAAHNSVAMRQRQAAKKSDRRRGAEGSSPRRRPIAAAWWGMGVLLLKTGGGVATLPRRNASDFDPACHHPPTVRRATPAGCMR